MSQILLTYDLQQNDFKESKHAEVKNEMKKMGYMDSWTANSKTYYLPNTTLWRKDVSLTQSKTDLHNCARKFGVIVERFVSVEFSSWDAIEGKPYR